MEVLDVHTPLVAATFILAADIPAPHRSEPGQPYFELFRETEFLQPAQPGRIAYRVCAATSSLRTLRALLEDYIEAAEAAHQSEAADLFC